MLAQQDLNKIGIYTRHTWGEKQKQQYLTHIKQSFADICSNSNIGRLHHLDNNLYAYLCQKHIIFYRTSHIEISIVRILHQSMNVEAHQL